MLTTYRCGTPREDDALRVGTVRFLPRGVPKADYRARGFFDVWLPTLAPSQEIIRRFKDGHLTEKAFFTRYRKEMKATDPRQLILLFAELSERTDVAIGCYCEDEAHCHRGVLAELIRAES